MIRLGLVGYPVEHSLSPQIHLAALRACGLQGEYALYPIPPGGEQALGDLLQRVRTGELQGLNITIPYKQAVLPFLDELAPVAKAIGAANTIYLRGGSLIGDNTDAAGFLADLGQFCPSPRRAMVLGGGGGARAILYTLESLGCEASLWVRRAAQGRLLLEQFPGLKLLELNPDSLRGVQPDLIVNTTPAGMFPETDCSPWPAGLDFPGRPFVYDLVYNPRETRLMRQAHTAGLQAVTGLGMLIEQAALAFELWTGCRPQRGPMRAALEQTVG